MEWNIHLTQAPTPAERERIYSSRADVLEWALRTTELPADDRELAVELLAAGSRLAKQDHPVDEAGEFNTVADMLVTRLDAAAKKADSKRIDRLARLLSRVADQGIAANLDRAPDAAQLDHDRQGTFDKINRNNAERAAQLDRDAGTAAPGRPQGTPPGARSYPQASQEEAGRVIAAAR